MRESAARHTHCSRAAVPQRARNLRQRIEPLHVVVACESVETLDGLQLYLRQAGVVARSTRALDPSMIRKEEVAAVVLFADDFPEREVVGFVTGLVGGRRGILPVLVTAEPLRFLRLMRSDDPAFVPIVLPKPAWGWTILDAIRGRMKAPE
jgi:hypothetical protein